jgi:catechol 2,3-dioxygenase-like lactoylglutathione lyase family enzyme
MQAEVAIFRVQLALNVTDIEAAVDFYSKLFGAEPAKRPHGDLVFLGEQHPARLTVLPSMPVHEVSTIELSASYGGNEWQA